MSETTDLRFFSDADLDTVVAVVMELAGQLHEERSQRIDLEERLRAAGALPNGDSPAREAAIERSREALGASMARIMRILEESGPPQHPIRSEARSDAWAVQHG